MAYIMTLLRVGNMLNVPLPTKLVRELGWPKGARVVVKSDGNGGVSVRPVEDYLRERAKRSGR